MKNYTDLNIVLDRSGSMSNIAVDMVGGIKNFLEKEKQTGDDTKVSLFQFDDRYETVFVDKDIKEEIEVELSPRGSTALNDSLGKTISFVGEKLSKMKEEDRPNRVLFLVITDGFENASKEYTKQIVQEKVKHQREKYSWDFVFLGVGEDAVFAQHKDLGIYSNSSLGLAANAGAISSGWSVVSDSYQLYKSLDRNNISMRSATFEMKKDSDDNKADLANNI